jgi:uncharacterized membrane protein
MPRYDEGTGTGLVVALASFAFYAVLAWIIAILFWIAFSIYAIVEIAGDGVPSAMAVTLIVMLLVTTVVVLAAVGIGLLGKRLLPAKRRD